MSIRISRRSLERKPRHPRHASRLRAAPASAHAHRRPRQSCTSRRGRDSVASRRDVVLRDQIVIGANRAAVIRRDERVERLENLRRIVAGDVERMRASRAETIAVAEEAPDHHAATVARKELHVLGELWKATVSDEILLNVGDVQRRELLTALADVVADRRKSMLAGGVADDGDDQVAGLEALHELEGILRRQVIRLVAGSVLLEEQLAISRVIGARRTSDARVAEVG